MKKLLVLLFSVFLLSSPSVFAEDISDFEIEGMSIGDSLLDYMTEEEILKEVELNKNDYYFLNEPNKYAEVYFNKNLMKYETVSFLFQNNATNEYISNKNEKYIISSIRGIFDYTNDIDGCLQKRDEISEVISSMFPGSQKIENVFDYGGDPSGESTTYAVYFDLDSGGEVEVSCYDYEESFRIKNNWSDILNVAIDTDEVVNWLNDF